MIEIFDSIFVFISYFLLQKIAIFDIIEPSEAIEEFKLQYPNATVLFHKVDVRKRADIENAFKKVVNTFGYVDVLANFAGILNEARIEDVIDINLVGQASNSLIDHFSNEISFIQNAARCNLRYFCWDREYGR